MIALLLLTALLTVPAPKLRTGAQEPGEPSKCVQCHRDLDERLSRSVRRSARSVHTRARVGCSDCHGGDPYAIRGGPEHASFQGRPTAAGIADFCGRCHQRERLLYGLSGHAKSRGAKPVVQCADCHGAHDVGDPPRLFRLGEYCASCHGLEYLPALPAPVRRLMEENDRLSLALQERRDRPLPAGARGEVRRLRGSVGEIIHRSSLELSAAQVDEWTAGIALLAGQIR